MHLTEALMAAFEATGERAYLDKAERIADLILRQNAAAADWRVPEHFHADWSVDRDYRGSDVFRPYGYTPGHALEWTRLALQLWALGGRKLAWLPDAARRLFAQRGRARVGSARGGLYYTTEYDGAPRVRDRLWWPICEGVGAAHFLARSTAPTPPSRVGIAASGISSRAGIDRPARRRLAPAARRFAEADRGIFRRQAGSLSRAAGVPDPALSDRRQSDARDFGFDVSARRTAATRANVGIAIFCRRGLRQGLCANSEETGSPYCDGRHCHRLRGMMPSRERGGQTSPITASLAGVPDDRHIAFGGFAEGDIPWPP